MSRKPKKSLVDLLGAENTSKLADLFNRTQAAADLRVIPAGAYRCLISDVRYYEAKNGTSAIRITLEVDEGEHKGARLWLPLWLTEAAMPMTKRDLGKLGINDLNDLSFHPGTVVAAHVIVEDDDNGAERNRVSVFDVVGRIGDPTEDPAFGEEVSR